MEPTTKLWNALAKARAEIPPIKKDGINPHFKSTFATLANIIETTFPILAKHGLHITQLPLATEKGAGIVTVLVHLETGESLTSELVLPLPDNRRDPQGAGGAITYSRRYAIQSILGLATEDEDDAHEASNPAPYKPKGAHREAKAKLAEAAGNAPEPTGVLVPLREFLAGNSIPESYVVATLIDKNWCQASVANLEDLDEVVLSKLYASRVKIHKAYLDGQKEDA